MPGALRNIAKILRETAVESCRRARAHGGRSASVCVYTNFRNLLIGIAGRRLPPMVECPCCGWLGREFLTLDCGRFYVPNAKCPACSSHERHRMTHLFLERRPPAFLTGSGRVFHFAPESHVHAFVSRNPALEYLALDLDLSQYRLRPGVEVDMHNLPMTTASATGIFCIHVLEHVHDDRACIQELHRVLAPGGEAVIMVPFMMGQPETEEYAAPDPEMWDHVRGYSNYDFKHRLAPFEYEEVFPESFLSQEEIKRYAIPDSQVIYLCKKA